MSKFAEFYEKHSDEEFLEFDRVETKLSTRPDLHAFIVLDKLVPGTSDIISASEHDEFFLGIDMEELDKVITEEIAVELIRCGVRVSEYDCLAMFT